MFLVFARLYPRSHEDCRIVTYDRVTDRTASHTGLPGHCGGEKGAIDVTVSRDRVIREKVGRWSMMLKTKEIQRFSPDDPGRGSRLLHLVKPGCPSQHPHDLSFYV